MMHPHHVKAPRGDGSLLMQPPLEQASSLLDQNLRQLRAWDADLQGRRVSVLRDQSRREILKAANRFHEKMGLGGQVDPDADGPLIVTGHQPELFHPGVWIKNFAVDAIAKASGGISLNLIVDNDLPKSSGIRVPTKVDDHLVGQVVDFDTWAGEIPYEDWSVQQTALFASFGQRVRQTLDPRIPDPLISELWPVVEKAAGLTDPIGLRFSAARHWIEANLGLRNLEVPISEVCETDAFRWFACHILAHLPRFVATHNEALQRYRDLYKIRSKNHPVPGLDREGEWLEAPFWIWRDSAPRRRPLMIRQNEATMDLKVAGETEPFGSLPLTRDREACCAVEELARIAEQGVRIRTRALTTTMFARLLLGDLFLHGIGGAKYDELGDEVIRKFFRIEPPAYLTLSMTLWVGLPVDPTIEDRIQTLHRRLRDLQYQPERFLADSSNPDVSSLIEEKMRLLAGHPQTRRERVARFRDLRRVTQSLATFLESLRQAVLLEKAELDAQARDQATARGRDWSFVVHSRARIVQAMAQVATLVPGA